METKSHTFSKNKKHFMYKAKIAGALLLLSTLTNAQTEQKTALPSFDKINANVSTNIILQKSDAPFISVKTSDSTTTSDIKAEVVDGTLMIRQGKKGETPSKITIGYLAINSILGTGAVSIKSNEVISADKLDLEFTGASKCKLDVSVNTLMCNTSGAASVSLNGNCNKLEAIVSGAASLKAENLVAENAHVNISGASTAKINVTNKLEGNASGASTLKYTGSPKEIQLNQSGASNVKSSDTVISADANGTTTVTTTTKGDSVKRYTFNGRYEIIVHEKRGEDTTSFSYIKRHRFSVRKQNWAGFELFENGYTTYDNNLTLPASDDYMSLNYGMKNLGCNLNLFEKDFRMAKGKVQVVTGLGFSWNLYNLKNKTMLNPDSSYTGYTYNTAGSFSKNKLRESFVTVPLLLELNTSKKDSRNFHIAAGVIGGVKLGSSTKQYYTMLGHEFHDLKHDDYNLFPFKLDATVRVGYGQFTMFATYSLTPLFEYGKGPELYPFTVGIRIVPF
ncbi:MAG: GIN domain-containing protein [Bacteroidia bacterium]